MGKRAAAPTGVKEFEQDGARWLYGRPDGQAVSAWFVDNVKLHAGMDPTEWANGLVVIEQTEKFKYTTENGDIEERQRLVYSPFVKAEARVLYFRRWLMTANAQRAESGAPQLTGVIERNRVPRVNDGSLRDNGHLPDGYFLHAVNAGEGGWVTHVGCSVNVAVYEREVRSGGHGRLIMDAPGEKMVEQTNRWGPDVNAIMAAQTGAIARALGLLGMLVIAGSSVATAEDVQEALSAGSAAPVATVALPGVPEREQREEPPKPEDQRAYALALLGQLKEQHPDRHEEVQAWAVERGLDWENLEDRQVRGVVRQLERKLAG